MTKNWKDIHLDFAYHGWDWETNYQKDWVNHGFTYEQTADWINIGMKPTDAHYTHWLTNQGYDCLWILNYGDDQLLRRNYQKSLDSPRSYSIPKKDKPWWLLLLAGILLITAKFLLS